MPTTDQAELKRHLVKLLRGGHAHIDVDDAVRDIDAPLAGKEVAGLSRTAWQIVEHMRICQRDILDYLTVDPYEEPPFPAGVWPRAATPRSDEAWQASLRQFRSDLQALADLVVDAETDLFETIRRTDHTVLREALIVADHNAYHIGQLVLLRMALGVESSDLGL